MATQETEKGSGSWLFGLVKGVFAITFLVMLFGIWLLFQDVRIFLLGEQVEARVVAVDTERGSNGIRYANSSTQYYPTFAFTDISGVERQVKNAVGFGEQFEVGDIQTVIYNSNDPTGPVRLENWRVYNGMGAFILYATLPILGMFAYGRAQGRNQDNQQRQRRNRLARERRARIKAEKEAGSDK